MSVILAIAQGKMKMKGNMKRTAIIAAAFLIAAGCSKNSTRYGASDNSDANSTAVGAPAISQSSSSSSTNLSGISGSVSTNSDSSLNGSSAASPGSAAFGQSQSGSLSDTNQASAAPAIPAQKDLNTDANQYTESKAGDATSNPPYSAKQAAPGETQDPSGKNPATPDPGSDNSNQKNQ